MIHETLLPRDHARREGPIASSRGGANKKCRPFIRDGAGTLGLPDLMRSRRSSLPFISPDSSPRVPGAAHHLPSQVDKALADKEPPQDMRRRNGTKWRGINWRACRCFAPDGDSGMTTTLTNVAKRALTYRRWRGLQTHRSECLCAIGGPREEHVRG